MQNLSNNLSDPNFWSMIGSLGTAIGSLITGVSVIVAIKQYKQPISKRIRVRYSTTIPGYGRNLGDQYFCITLDNRGLVPVRITSVNLYISAKRRIFFGNEAITYFEQGAIPITVDSGESFSVNIAYNILSEELNKVIGTGKIGPWTLVRVGFDDSQGDKHICKKAMFIRTLMERP